MGPVISLANANGDANDGDALFSLSHAANARLDKVASTTSSLPRSTKETQNQKGTFPSSLLRELLAKEQLQLSTLPPPRVAKEPFVALSHSASRAEKMAFGRQVDSTPEKVGILNLNE